MELYKRKESSSLYAGSAELLAPAGSYETMMAAVAAGADAVYLGGNLFGARAYANNLDTETLKSAIDFVHLHGRKLYLTVNTLLKEQELRQKLFSYLLPFYEHGLDAVIVQDIGVFSFIKRNFPKLSIHASTQMTLTGAYGAKLLKEMGASRIVTARELSLEEIREIHHTKGLETIEIESFVHGALCYCYSGQCLFSSLLGGRSGNRGRCAQPCRLPYQAYENGKKQNKKEESYLLSPKDLCSIELLPDLLEAGVSSLKIEGRMKRSEYTAGVVSIYRKYLDMYQKYGRKGFSVSEEDKQILNDLYNRGGFTKGYYLEKNGRDMMFFEGKEADPTIKNEALFEAVRKNFLNSEPKEAIVGKISVYCGEKTALTIQWKGKSITVLGAETVLAEKQPMTIEKIRKQIEKTGGTPFYFSDLLVETDGISFVSVTELNQLRRTALEQLKTVYLSQFYRKSISEKASFLVPERKRVQERKKTKTYPIHVSLEKKEYVELVANVLEVSSIYLDASEFSAEDVRIYKKRFLDKQFYYMLPPIFRDNVQSWLEKEYPLLLEAGIDGFVARNLDELSFLLKNPISIKNPVPIRLDASLYGFQSESMQVFKQLGKAELITLPLELNGRELAQIADERSELIVYGYLPMMVSAQCTRKSLKGCSHKSGILTLADRYRNEFFIKNRCKFCYNRIYNCRPLSLLSAKKEVDLIAPCAVRLDFTIESEEEVIQILNYFIDAYQNDILFSEEPFAFTRGHLKRGIE